MDGRVKSVDKTLGKEYRNNEMPATKETSNIIKKRERQQIRYIHQKETMA
jgi:hypothetical protein